MLILGTWTGKTWTPWALLTKAYACVLSMWIDFPQHGGLCLRRVTKGNIQRVSISKDLSRCGMAFDDPAFETV